jgi:hypothetical protein
MNFDEGAAIVREGTAWVGNLHRAVAAPPTAHDILREVRRIPDLECFRRLRAEWERLAAEVEDWLLCRTYAYCELAAERAFADGDAIEIASVHLCADLLALWPLAISRKGPIRIGRGLTWVQTGHIGDTLDRAHG